jgi:SAM-dependent methyltransferase
VKGDFERYLTAKETVDDRALDRRVLGRVRDDLRSRETPRILEAGAGTAALLRRILGWKGLPDCTYVAVDTDPDLLSTARDRLLDRARRRGFEASVVDPTVTALGLDDAGTTVAALRLRGPARIDVRLVAGDALAVAAGGGWDFLLAQAFADLLTPAEVDRLVSGVVAGGGVYLPITFDGGTAFVPSHPADDAVLDAYHATMTGESGERLGATAGRQLLTLLPDTGVEIDVVGGSDWVVPPVGSSVADMGEEGSTDGEESAGEGGRTYPADESYFLGVIVDTVADAVRGRVAPDVLDAWLDVRRRQRENGRLGFLARNLDLYGRVR